MKWKIFAFAKINRFLWVGTRDPTGYHPLVTFFQTVALWDEITLRCLQPDGPFEVRWTIDPAVGLDPEATTLAQAVRRLVEGRTPRLTGVWHIRLRKQIPIAAGLGGGSADAAALLMALNEIWGLGLSVSELHEHARAIGMDVPFFLYGGRALAGGYGDRVWPLPDDTSAEEWFVLWVPPERAVTRVMYQRLDVVRPEAPVRPDVLTLLDTPTRLAAALEEAANDFVPVIETTWPEGAAWKERLRRLGAHPVQWSGSGLALWGRFTHAYEAWRAYQALQAARPPGTFGAVVPALSRRAWRAYIRLRA
ncbi:MAG: 4-(cytidine 5'-diphospho)-2-C-methyl-D-erythritol kinase [Acidobacteria bacterium]|nr:4-(cytidine 5'-diphospho)-2-C-methyl-D-erythritol kinase [Acidobacteriota bacterium]MDW7984326.1 4-(cytidine 5'-diphospho)-2-C-methyl-D-erythritol kinase [Acidobacteriota bacterium]